MLLNSGTDKLAADFRVGSELYGQLRSLKCAPSHRPASIKASMLGLIQDDPESRSGKLRLLINGLARGAVA